MQSSKTTWGIGNRQLLKVSRTVNYTLLTDKFQRTVLLALYALQSPVKA